jgi:hypothetical protein
MTAPCTSSSLTGVHADGSKLGMAANLARPPDLRPVVALGWPGAVACDWANLESSSSSTGNPAAARSALKRRSTGSGSAQNRS